MVDDEEPNSHLQYIYELPYKERKMLCNTLDINDKWEELGGVYMKFDCGTLYKLGKAVMRNRSPSDELLCLWGTQNHTVLDLFVLLSKMRHYQAMRILKPFVDAKYHHLLYEGEDHVSQLGTTAAFNVGQVYVDGTNKQVKNEPVLDQMKRGIKVEDGVNDVNGGRGGQSRRADKKLISIKEIDLKIAAQSDQQQQYQTKTRNSSAATDGFSGESCTPLILYEELEAATNGWDKKNVLGKGGFGIVFKGVWKNTAVAIKRLETQKASEMEYNDLEGQRQQSLKELRYLNSYRHDNVLPLYGCSIGGEKPCLIYQYMPNGSLEDRLQCKQGTKPLNWLQRHKIATGIARGLQFLHGFDKPLVHGDIKSANILLDQHYEARIGDFGLAREGPLQQYTHVKVSRVHGTRPYLPDEFLRGKKFSTKVDTYSFGVVMFELATGLRAYDDGRQYKFLKDYVITYDESRICDIIDSKAGLDDAHTFPALVALGKWCVKERPKERPHMVQVLTQLDGMMTARHMAYTANFLMHRQQSSVTAAATPQTPMNPYEMLLFPLDKKKVSVAVTPSASYHPQPWLFASNAMGVPARSMQPQASTVSVVTSTGAETAATFDNSCSVLPQPALSATTNIINQQQQGNLPPYALAQQYMNIGFTPTVSCESSSLCEDCSSSPSVCGPKFSVIHASSIITSPPPLPHSVVSQHMENDDVPKGNDGTFSSPSMLLPLISELRVDEASV